MPYAPSTCRSASITASSSVVSNAASIRWTSTSVSVSEVNTCPVSLEHAPERARVLDDAVMHDGDLPPLVELRVGVALVRRPVRCPARVRDAERPDDRARVDRRLESRDLARHFAGLDALPVHDGDAGGVVPAVLEPLQPLNEQWRDDLGADVADDSTHR